VSSISKPRSKAAGFPSDCATRNKSMRLAMTCGYRVFVCSNMAFAGGFTPVLAKHSEVVLAHRLHFGRC
jgi:hypothetical protein